MPHAMPPTINALREFESAATAANDSCAAVGLRVEKCLIAATMPNAPAANALFAATNENGLMLPEACV